MPRPDAPSGRTGRPPVTDRARILAAARRIIERDGWEKLTVRRLAADLGIGTTTLYHHVRDREDLLVQLINEVAETTLHLDLPEAPRDRVIAAATAIHDALAALPWAAEILITDGFLGRLGEPALRMVEVIVAGAVECGCTPEQAVDVFRSVWYYLVGEILVRVHSVRRQAGNVRPADDEAFFGDDLDMSQIPHLAALGDRWEELAARDTFPQGIEAFVDGLLARATR
ncbi:TetR/AcrR family transcriptional regulator [Actinomadura hibisca]|uniref:TetR/AcrR family transcriptional regulator n=1 Tax=Actinomadura hibisca TaxID=68565 RepID=UPI000831A1DD|nr:TetR family transcriptional regulator [Actinomadura hibisca]